jgi:hypothetical protein
MTELDVHFGDGLVLSAEEEPALVTHDIWRYFYGFTVG